MKIKDLKDIHKKDKIIFIVGGAPSCVSWDINLIKDYPIIAVNSGLIKVKNINKNFYFLSDDQAVRHWSYFRDLKDLNTINLLYKDKLEKHSQHLDQKKTIYFTHKSFFSPPNTYHFPGIKLTKSEPLIGSRLSTGTAIHVSFICGASVCVLLGCDCRCSKEGHRYFFQYWDKKDQPYRLDYDFNKKTQNMGASYKDFIDYWRHFSENNKEILQNEFKVINCSDTPSDFDFFPKMSIEEVLEKYGKEK